MQIKSSYNSTITHYNVIRALLRYRFGLVLLFFIFVSLLSSSYALISYDRMRLIVIDAVQAVFSSSTTCINQQVGHNKGNASNLKTKSDLNQVFGFQKGNRKVNIQKCALATESSQLCIKIVYSSYFAKKHEVFAGNSCFLNRCQTKT